MKKTLAVLAILACSPTAAFADDDCFVPLGDWQPREAITRLAEKNGWTINRLRIDDGCYKINGLDNSGRRIEVKIHPKSLAIIGKERDHDDD